MCEVGSNKCDNTILLTLSNSTQYTMGHYTVKKKSLNKSDDKKSRAKIYILRKFT
jgi:hypothetical protein